MMPDDYQKLKEDIRKAILKWCDGAGVDPNNAAQVEACAREIYTSLEESNVLHPSMSYAGFVQAIREGIFLAQFRDMQELARQQLVPKRTMNVKCEVSNL
jgi:hypothetical protein